MRTKPSNSRAAGRQTGGISIFEYACHEGNYAMEGILKGARAQEKAGTANQASPR